MTKLFAEYLKEADDNPANIIMSVAELIRKDMDSENEVAKTSIPFFLMQLRNAGLPISYSGLKAYYNAHPELKNVIKTFNDEDIIFVGQGDEADGETLGEPQGDIPPEEVVDNMAKRAMNKRMNEEELPFSKALGLDDTMIEGKDEGVSKEEEDEFHVALDDLVHKTFGHSSMEKKKKMEDNEYGYQSWADEPEGYEQEDDAMPTHVPSGKFKGDKIIVGKEAGISPFNYYATVDSYDYADDTGANSPVGRGKTPDEAVEDLLDQLDQLDEEVVEEFDYWQSPESLSKLAGLSERKLSKSEEGKREKYVKGMKKAKGDFKDRYGKDAESVMYATATKMAKGGK